MSYSVERIAETLKAARKTKKLSKTELGAKVGLPQSHISKIESGHTDLKVSSLIEISRVLDLELVLAPRKLLPAVQSMIRNDRTIHARTANIKITANPAAVTRGAYMLEEGEDDA